MRQIALHVHLALLALGRRGQRDDAEHARADALGDRLDRAALAGAVAPLEDDADLQPLVLDPLLQLDELDVQPRELLVVVLALQLLFRLCANLVRLALVALLGFHGRSPFRGDCRRNAVSGLEFLESLHRRLQVEEHPFVAQRLAQLCAPHYREHPGIEPRQPERDARRRAASPPPR